MTRRGLGAVGRGVIDLLTSFVSPFGLPAQSATLRYDAWASGGQPLTAMRPEPCTRQSEAGAERCRTPTGDAAERRWPAAGCQGEGPVKRGLRQCNDNTARLSVARLCRAKRTSPPAALRSCSTSLRREGGQWCGAASMLAAQRWFHWVSIAGGPTSRFREPGFGLK